MSRPIFTFLAIIASVGSVEGLAWWWMSHSAVGPGDPILAYRPTVGLERRAHPDSANGVENLESKDTGTGTEPSGEKGPCASSPALSASAPAGEVGPVAAQATITPLPESYRQDAPMLRCSDGEVFRVDTPENLSLHLAWFEWNDTDTGSVLEAFRHMPEACLGSIGMKLVSKEKPIPFQVGPDRRAGRDSANAQESQRGEIVDVPSSSSHTQSPIHNPQSPISLTFDHTIFEEPDGTHSPLRTPIHSFRAVWVSGLHDTDARRGIGGRELDRLRAIRLKSAIDRYRPGHARVIQGTVRGALNTADAWQAFEQHMLRHLTLERL